jgi:hypothetical protein
MWRHPASGLSIDELIDSVSPDARSVTRLA